MTDLETLLGKVMSHKKFEFIENEELSNSKKKKWKEKRRKIFEKIFLPLKKIYEWQARI